MTAIRAKTVEAIRAEGGVMVVFTAAELAGLSASQRRDLADLLVEQGNSAIDEMREASASQDGAPGQG
ncbi:hypothetical protein J2T57_001602 [Natronocella acetinitrilica]|uniref:Uncharacterized protein n=1 Tax=Natronocella acetinitrilica TaxID=414046 RepID=A0AAE3G299_9GAMM|nr:hypothetical protein [Natronocella acetinitrilica]MCP1674500.1 hypothetical protein [Natronocella acetinitrilica]